LIFVFSKYNLLLQIKGEGMEISDFTRDLTAEAKSGLIGKPIGREKELSFILKTISQRDKPNVMIIGPAGIGKTVLAEGVAYMLVYDKNAQNCPKKKVLELNLTAMNSGAMYVGQFEERVTKFLSYIRNNPDIVVFIDEIHMIMGFGRTSDSGASRDFSQIIKPMLTSGELCCIGATTKNEYETYIAPDNAFARRFHLLELSPLSTEVVLQILHQAAVKIKYRSGIEFTDSCLKEIIEASEEIYPQRYHPDKSLDILRRISALFEKEITLSYQKEEKSLKEYIHILEKEIKMLKKEDYSELGKLAKRWLDVDKQCERKVQLTKDEIIKLLKVGAQERKNGTV
jgi:ATP-dependent Clp protease ATP-binding subunit ClpA